MFYWKYADAEIYIVDTVVQITQISLRNQAVNADHNWSRCNIRNGAVGKMRNEGGEREGDTGWGGLQNRNRRFILAHSLLKACNK